MYAPPNIPAYPNPAGPFADFLGSVTPFVRWIMDYPFRKNSNVKKRPADHGEIGEITFPPLPNAGFADPVIIKAYISGRQVNRVYLDGASSTAMKQIEITVSTVHEAIKFHTPRGIGPIFSEYNSQKPKEEEGGSTSKYQGNEEIVLSCIDTEERSRRVDSNTPLVGFSGEQSWPLGEIPLEITIGEGTIVVTKTLTFVIIKLDSLHNLLLGRTAMKQIEITVSTVHGAIKFHTSRGIGPIFSEYNS
nr:hypothetical protein [Tanacetum cinerariifolium]